MDDLQPQDPGTTMHRRALLRTGAVVWTVPTIVSITAAPSLASSLGSLAVDPGTTDTEPVSGGADMFYDVVTSGVTVTPSAAVAANQLQLVITFQPRAGSNSNCIYRYAYEPTGWTCPVPGATGYDTLTYTYTGTIIAGTPYAFPDGSFFGTNYGQGFDPGEGVFTLTFTATGQTSAGFSVATPDAMAGKSGLAQAATTTRHR